MALRRHLPGALAQIGQALNAAGPAGTAREAAARTSTVASCSYSTSSGAGSHAWRHQASALRAGPAAAISGLPRLGAPGCPLAARHLPASSRGLLDYVLAPRPLPRFRKVDKQLTWQRMVIRIPPEVAITLEDQQLTFAGRVGTLSMDLRHMDPTGLLAMRLVERGAAGGGGGASGGVLLLCASPSKRYFRGIQTHIDNAVRGVSQGYLQGVTVKGVGFRIDPVEQRPALSRWHFERGPEPKLATAFPYQKPAHTLRLKVGYTKSAIYPLPEGVRAFLVRPTLTYLFGVDKALVRSSAMALRRIRPPNVYTGNGVQLADEQLVLKPRGGKK